MKPGLSWTEQVELPRSRGLAIGDATGCADFLAANNYYRFSGYARYFQTAPHQGNNTFRPGVTFEDVRAIYEAD